MKDSLFLLSLKDRNPDLYNRLRKSRERRFEQKRINIAVERELFWRDAFKELDALTIKASSGLEDKDIVRLFMVLIGMIRRG